MCGLCHVDIVLDTRLPDITAARSTYIHSARPHHPDMISNILYCLHQFSSSLQRVQLIMIKFSSIFAARPLFAFSGSTQVV